jgi:hypothetical protein
MLVTSKDGFNWSYSPKKVWPGSNMDFYAYSPANSRNIETRYLKMGDGGETKLTYRIPADTQGYEQMQEDFLIARAKDCPDGSTVQLSFQHALSRVLFRARSGVKGMDFTVTNVKLCNLNSEATIDLANDSIPTTSAGFDYSDGNTSKYSTLWAVKQSKRDFNVTLPGGPVYLQANQPAGTYTPLHADVNALMVIPQTTELGSKVYTNQDPADGKLYLAVTYKAGEQSQESTTYMSVCKPGTTDVPLCFQMGRQYIFNITISGQTTGLKEIDFSIDIADYDTTVPNVPAPVAPQPEPIAYSNIFWDAQANGGKGGLNFYTTPATFAIPTTKAPDINDDMIQGVFFRFGSLVGVSPAGTQWDNTLPVYMPIGNKLHNNTKRISKNDILNAYKGDSISDLSPIEHATSAWKATGYSSGDPDWKGDICAYLTDGQWRLPTLSDFGPFSNWALEGTFTSTTSSQDGLSRVTEYVTSGKINIPMGGWREWDDARLVSVSAGRYWTSEVYTMDYQTYKMAQGISFYFNKRNGVTRLDLPINTYCPVRCVRD